MVWSFLQLSTSDPTEPTLQFVSTKLELVVGNGDKRDPFATENPQHWNQQYCCQILLGSFRSEISEIKAVEVAH